MKNVFKLNYNLKRSRLKPASFYLQENEMIRMCKRNGNSKRNSRFICLRCLKENTVGAGMSRPNTKEIDHVKNLICLCVGLEMKTKNLEVRWCDDLSERMERAREMKPIYYDKNNELLPKWQTENMYIRKRG